MTFDDLIEIIKNRSLSEVLAPFVSLKKQGPNMVGLCPFHVDSNPSLVVNNSKGLFKCFVCDIGGDAITFVQKFLNLDFKSAINEIAKSLGLEMASANKKKDPKIQHALDLLSQVASYYFSQGLDSKQSQNPLFWQFVENRRLKEETIKSFQIGYAPAFGGLLNIISKDQYPLALEIGLLKRNEKNPSQLYDLFRDRIIFPIVNLEGNVVGFSSRALHEYQKAKYLNSSESFIFNKRFVLYGGSIAKKYAQEKNQLIITEGNMDCIALHGANIKNSVAIMGVGLTANMIQNIMRWTKNIVLALDSDTAGMAAMARLNSLFLAQGVIPRYLDFSPHKDPDEYICEQKAIGFKVLLDQADVFLNKRMQDLSFPDPENAKIEEKIVRLESFYEELRPLQDSLVALEKITQFAQKLQIKLDPSEIIKQYRNFIQGKHSQDLKEKEKSYFSLKEKKYIPVPTALSLDKLDQKELLHPRDIKIIKILLRGVVMHPKCTRHPKVKNLLNYVEHCDMKDFFEELSQLYLEVDEGQWSNILRRLIENEGISSFVKEILGSLMFEFRIIPMDDKQMERHLHQLEVHIQKEQLSKKWDELMAQAENTNEAFLEKIQEVSHQLMALN